MLVWMMWLGLVATLIIGLVTTTLGLFRWHVDYSRNRGRQGKCK